MSLDLNHTPDTTVAKWSETRWSCCWNPDERVAVYIHAGRFRDDLDMWWVQTAALLPDGGVVVDRSWARQPDPRRIRTCALDFRQEDDGSWSSTFDGVGELTTPAALAAGPRGAGCPSVGLRWSTGTTPASALYDLYESPTGTHLQQAADSHIQQAFHSTGTLEVAGCSYPLTGVGFKDHSSGVRAWEGYHSHQFALFMMPSHTVHMIAFHGDAGSQFVGVTAGPDSRVPLIESHVEGMDDLLGVCDDGRLTVRSDTGDTTTFQVEVLQQFPITINEAGDNLNGLDWERDVPTICLMESFARFTTPDGEVGYGFLERGALRDHLKRPDALARRF